MVVAPVGPVHRLTASVVFVELADAALELLSVALGTHKQMIQCTNIRYAYS